MIDRNAIESRLGDLRQDEANCQAVVEQYQANLYALRGAIQDCEHWLDVVDAPIEESPNVEGLPDGVEVKEVVFLDEHR